MNKSQNKYKSPLFGCVWERKVNLLQPCTCALFCEKSPFSKIAIWFWAHDIYSRTHGLSVKVDERDESMRQFFMTKNVLKLSHCLKHTEALVCVVRNNERDVNRETEAWRTSANMSHNTPHKEREKQTAWALSMTSHRVKFQSMCFCVQRDYNRHISSHPIHTSVCHVNNTQKQTHIHVIRELRPSSSLLGKDWGSKQTKRGRKEEMKEGWEGLNRWMVEGRGSLKVKTRKDVEKITGPFLSQKDHIQEQTVLFVILKREISYWWASIWQKVFLLTGRNLK